MTPTNETTDLLVGEHAAAPMGDAHSHAAGDSAQRSAAGAAQPQPARPPRVLVVDADCALNGLLEEWLGAAGCAVIPEAGRTGGAGERYDLVIVDVPFPRQGGVDLIARIAHQHPKTPILALSSTFFAGIECCGPVARALGVACVLPKPASRDALIGAVSRLLPARLAP